MTDLVLLFAFPLLFGWVCYYAGVARGRATILNRFAVAWEELAGWERDHPGVPLEASRIVRTIYTHVLGRETW